MKIALTTVGCKLNQYETSAMSELLEKDGFEIVSFNNKADIYVINSCAVTKKAETDTKRFIRKSKVNNPKARIILTGCWTKLIDKNSICDVDLVLDNNLKSEISSSINKLIANTSSEISYRDSSFFPIMERFTSHSRAFIKIQDGCNCHCSYCVVPHARGKSRSEKPEKIIEQAKTFIDNGYKEIVLTGINIGAYGKDSSAKTNLACRPPAICRAGQTGLAELLKKLINIPRLGRIRLSSIEPQEFNQELIEIIANSKICPHLHIPLQSGDDFILKTMNRRYSRKDYLGLTENLFKKIPDLNLGTDVIVGFPGEADELFEKTYGFIENIPFSYLHIFRYSKRPNTLAEKIENQIPEKLKKERAKKLSLLNHEKKYIYTKKFLNKTLPTFIENRIDPKTKRWIGLTGNYLRLFVNGPEEIKNQIVMAKITEIGDKILAEVG